MSRRLRNWVAVVSALALVAAAAPVAASDDYDQRSSAPVLVDVLILRPLGLMAFATGAAIMAVVAPMVLLVRPQGIHKPYDLLVLQPARYVWVDPLGTH
jgi:hypothetical protein